MIRSMYAAVSGLSSHQTMMDVVGNNIANVNTHGYKKSNALFQDVLSQTINGAGAPTEEIGGTNPAQVGLGVAVTAIAQNMSQGFLQVTGRDLDMAIEGDGFFVVNQAGEQLYTRAGAFFIEADGRLVTSDGGLVQGWKADDRGEINTAATATEIRIWTGENINPVQTSEINFGGNLPGDAEIGALQFAGLNVFDSQGNAIALDVEFVKTAVDEWTVTATYGNPATPITLTDNVLTFDANGEIVNPADLSINIAAGQIPDVGDVEITLGGDQDRRVTQFGGSPSITAIYQDGSATGTLQSVSVGRDGVIVGVYTNGLVQPIAQMALATFNNPDGLERVSGSNWRASTNSGLAQVGVVGTGGRGLMAPGTLEMSNVDLAEEFTTLIRSQRGFQANSRVVTTSDELLQEIVNLKR